MSPQIEIVCIAVLVSINASLPGSFLVLRKMALISDAISHAVLPGIVVGFIITHHLDSPVLIIGAAGAGLLSVFLIELVYKSGLIKQDAAIGLVFPALFSVGVILISQLTHSVDLDADCVLMGEIAFTPFNRFHVGGMDLGPKALWTTGIMLLLSVSIIFLLYKEMKLCTFDEGLGRILGFKPGLVHYLLMILVALTTVSSFSSVGSILVVALMIVPPATALLLVNTPLTFFITSAILGGISAITGYSMAHFTDSSIAGGMATMAGVWFLLAYLFSPSKGVVGKWLVSRKNRLQLGILMLLVHLFHHENQNESPEERQLGMLPKHLNWDRSFLDKVTRKAIQGQYLEKNGQTLVLHGKGRTLAQEALTGRIPLGDLDLPRV